MSEPNPQKHSFKEKFQRSLPIIIMIFMLILVIAVTVIACVKAIGGTSSKTTTLEQPLFTHPVATEPVTEPTTEAVTEATTTRESTTAKPMACHSSP